MHTKAEEGTYTVIPSNLTNTIHNGVQRVLDVGECVDWRDAVG